MYLVNYAQPDIAFVIKLLARYSSSSIRRHLIGVKHILRYLKGIMNMNLYFFQMIQTQI